MIRRDLSFGEIVAMAAVESAACGAINAFALGLFLVVDAGLVETGAFIIFLPLLGVGTGFIIGWVPAILCGSLAALVFGGGPLQAALAGLLTGSALLITFAWPTGFVVFFNLTSILFLFSACGAGLFAWRLVMRGTDFSRTS